MTPQPPSAPPSRTLLPWAALLLLAGAAAHAAAAPGGWRLVGPADPALGAVAVPPAPFGTLFTGRLGGGLFRATDDGALPLLSLAPDAFACPFGPDSLLVADPRDPARIYATLGHQVAASADGGRTWQAGADPAVGKFLDLLVLPGPPGHLLALGDSTGIAVLSPSPPCYPALAQMGIVESRDGGATWTPFRPYPAAGGLHFTALASDPAHPERIYLGSYATGAVGLSDGAGFAASLPDLPFHATVRALRVDAGSAGSTPPVLYALGDQLYRIPLNAAGGAAAASWQALLHAPPIQYGGPGSLLVDPRRPGTLYALASSGVWTSTDHGDSWSAITGDLAGQNVAGLALDGRRNGPLYAATARGLWAFDRAGCAVDATSTCLADFRFSLTAVFQIPGGAPTDAHLRALTGDTADAWFFSPANLELLIKVLDGRALNQQFWVFSGGLSDVQYTLTVTDTVGGQVHGYSKDQGKMVSFADTSAFPGPAPKAGGEIAEIAEIAPPPAEAAALDSSGFADFAGVPAACTSSATRLCVQGARFQVAVTFSSPPFGGDAHAVPLTDDTGSFWFFSPDNLELAVKVLDGREINGHFWVFYGALSDVAYTLQVTDSQTGTVRTYRNDKGHLASFADTAAF